MIDAFIINNNLYTMPKAMVDKLVTLQGIGKIIIVDNGSTSLNTLSWYASDNRIIIERLQNIGHKSVWVKRLPSKYRSTYYVVTDPDLDISTLPQETLLHLKSLLMKYQLPKVGLSIKINDVPGDSIYNLVNTPLCGLESERRFLECNSNIDLVFAPVDTTFAIYPPNNLRYKVAGARANYPYECRHLPFYFTLDSLKADAEYMYYLNNANNSSSLKYFLNKNGIL